MNKLEDYFNYEYLDELAEKEKIYYSPSVGWDKINSKKVNKNKLKLLKEINDKVLSGNYELVPYKVKLIIKNKPKNKILLYNLFKAKTSLKIYFIKYMLFI